MKKVIVIGAGIGGLAIGIRLQSRGYDVTIVEKNNIIGGHASRFTESGYTFDMGPTFLTALEVIDSLFKVVNKKVEDLLDLSSLDPFFRIFFKDNTSFDYSGDAEKMKIQMARFNQRDAGLYDDFLKNSKKIYDEIIGKGYGSLPFSNLSSMIKFLPKAIKLKLFKSNYGLTSSYFDDYRHRFIFSFHPLFIGGNPFRTSSIYSMMPYVEQSIGMWFVKNGMYNFINTLQNIFTDLGGKIITSFPVSKILINSKKVIGVMSDSNKMLADIVISNSDVSYTYSQLIDTEKSNRWNKDRIINSKYANSNFLIFLGVKKKYPKLLHHNIIFSQNYKDTMTDIFDKNILPQNFPIYINVSSITDPSMAPENCESIYISTPVPNLKSNIDWNEFSRSFTNQIINYLETDFDLVGLRSNIVVEKVFSPLDFSQKRNSYLGSPWGLEPIIFQSAYFRPHNKSEEYENLNFVGAGTHPGASIPGVLMSAEATEKCIIKDNF